MKYYLTDDIDKKIIHGLSSLEIVQSLKGDWQANTPNRQYMKDFRTRAIATYGDKCKSIHVNSCRNFINDLISLDILTPVRDR